MSGETRFTQEDIVRVAFGLVRRYGWEGLSARAIAEELGSSTMPIYSKLKSMNYLEEEVVKKAFELMRQFMDAKRTGDQWLDFGLGYVLFAREERNLFRRIREERYVHFYQRYCRPQFKKNYEALRNHHLFKGLDEKEIEWIVFTRYSFVYGIASLTNAGLLDMSDDDLIEYLKDVQATLLKGVKAARSSGKEHPYGYMRFMSECMNKADGNKSKEAASAVPGKKKTSRIG